MTQSVIASDLGEGPVDRSTEFRVCYGPACPGHLFKHSAATGGSDKPGHDDESGGP